MTEPDEPGPQSQPGAVPASRCPARAEGGTGAVPLDTPEFGRDPFAVYRRLRETHGPLVPVELDPGVTATLCVGYETALEILRRPDTFSKDPRRWRARNEGRVPDSSHAAQMIRYRPMATAVDGEEHRRYRAAIDDSTSRIDPGALRGYVERIADSLIDLFCATGEADLVGDYAALLPLLVLGELFGCPREAADRLFTGMAKIFDGTDVGSAGLLVADALRELIDLKRARPAADVTSWLIAHPERLTDEELVEQLGLLMASGSEPVINLIGNALRVLLTDDRFAGGLSGGSLLVEDALDEVLWTDPPLANLAVHFPRHDVDLAGVRLREGEPVVISFAGANQDALRVAGSPQGNRAHLAFSAGPHMCPGRSSARLISAVAIERLLDRLPDLALAVPPEELLWRPGIYQRGLVALPAHFPPAETSAARDAVPAGDRAPAGSERKATTPAAPESPAGGPAAPSWPGGPTAVSGAGSAATGAAPAEDPADGPGDEPTAAEPGTTGTTAAPAASAGGPMEPSGAASAEPWNPAGIGPAGVPVDKPAGGPSGHGGSAEGPGTPAVSASPSAGESDVPASAGGPAAFGGGMAGPGSPAGHRETTATAAASVDADAAGVFADGAFGLRSADGTDGDTDAAEPEPPEPLEGAEPTDPAAASVARGRPSVLAALKRWRRLR